MVALGCMDVVRVGVLRLFSSEGAGMDMIPLSMALVRQQELWGVYGEADEIALRKASGSTWENCLPFDCLPQARPFIFGLMARADGEILQEATVVRVDPGQVKEIAPISSGHFYIIGIDSPGAATLVSVQQESPILSGETWWVYGKAGLSLKNPSGHLGLYLVVSLIPNAPATLAPEPLHGDLPA